MGYLTGQLIPQILLSDPLLLFHHLKLLISIYGSLHNVCSFERPSKGQHWKYPPINDFQNASGRGAEKYYMGIELMVPSAFFSLPS